MAAQPMPDVTGKGPSLIREMLEIFKETEANLGNISGEVSEKVKALCDKGQEMEPLLTRAYMKTVKAGETSYQCKQMAEELKEAVNASDETKALEIEEKLTADLEGLIKTAKTFVVRMT